MDTQVLSKIEAIFQEEKWTRAPLSSYTEASITELHTLVDETDDEDAPDVLTLCEEHLSANKNSVPALYIGGVLSIRHHKEDDGYLVKLIKLIFDNQRKTLVETIMKLNPNLYNNELALRTLAIILEERDDAQELNRIRQLITLVDTSETDLLSRLAQEKEKKGDHEGAISDLKNLIHRLLLKKQFSRIRDAWLQLIKLAPKDIEFYYLSVEKVAEALSPERAIQLMELYFPLVEKHFLYDEIIEYNKKMLAYDKSNVQVKTRLVDAYRKKYADNKNLEKFIQDAQILGDWRDAHEAISDFERHIAFAENNFVFHKSWGVGIVRKVSSSGITFDFSKKRNHTMSFHMASSALEVLPKDHIKVLKSIVKHETLVTKTKKSPLWALEIILKSYGGQVDLKTIRSELVPSVLSLKEWTSWGTKARALLKSNTKFGVLPDTPDVFFLKSAPSSFIEHTLERFYSLSEFSDRIAVFEKFASSSNIDFSKEEIAPSLKKMLSYFAEFTQGENVSAKGIASAMLLEQYSSVLQPNTISFQSFESLLKRTKDLDAVFKNIKSNSTKKKFLALLVSDQSIELQDIYLLFPNFISRDFLKTLEEFRGKESIQGLYYHLLSRASDLRFPFIWLVRTLKINETFATFELSLTDAYLAVIKLLILSQREITSGINLSLNRKILKYGQEVLYESGTLESFFRTHSWNEVHPIYTLIQADSPFNARITVQLTQIVTKVHGDKLVNKTSSTIRKTQKLIATRKAIEKKKLLLTNYTNVELPRLSKEIEKARSFGDLKENAEYKAAKEQQATLNAKIKTLQNELQNVAVFSPSKTKPPHIQFGCEVSLQSDHGESLQYTILGPWESNPEKNIISYLSPLGIQLNALKIGETVEVALDGKTLRYRIDAINAASEAVYT